MEYSRDKMDKTKARTVGSRSGEQWRVGTHVTNGGPRAFFGCFFFQMTGLLNYPKIRRK